MRFKKRAEVDSDYDTVTQKEFKAFLARQNTGCMHPYRDCTLACLRHRPKMSREKQIRLSEAVVERMSRSHAAQLIQRWIRAILRRRRKARVQVVEEVIRERDKIVFFHFRADQVCSRVRTIECVLPFQC